MTALKLFQVDSQERHNFLELLMLADESKEIVLSYIDQGELFSIKKADLVVGVVLFTFLSKNTVELKNIALKEAYRNKGLGKQIVNQAEQYYRDNGYDHIIVCTANSSIANIAFYQKAGFRLIDIEKDFFNQYPTPIYEYGILAQDKLIFSKAIL
ncbi:GNAT family N-acetyltransferase [Amphibacillus cookii]|uniref:GNAT family N-acetyltransferase n=1 Tax=Amphibacillus cookii TaxID=767787 RepID=UPI00195BEB4B|nr:GNAT family N-acetyltransferase [Amphibacillus cookii]MBM7539904.1 ribosomal protein S18 acetylase RimI-like enzyme [Amphibacillus cookii]